MFRKFRAQGPWLVVSAIVFGLIVSSFAVAAGEGSPILGGKRNPGSNGSRAFSSETEIIANNGSYGTRQSNKSDNGGGAIYGCRSKAGGTPKGNEPCIRASNLVDGRAFEFENKGGTEVGAITSSNANAAPFTTNAHGVATGLNADQVDGKSADEISADAVKTAQANAQGMMQFAQVSSTGTLGGNRGVTSAARTGAGTYTVVFANDVSGCALTATEATTDDAGAAAVTLGTDKKTATVVTRSGGGTATTPTPTVATDKPFHLVASC
jgi:hypothetical protein